MKYSMKVAVSSLVLDPNKRTLLLIKREKAPFKDCWSLPGGHLEENEQIEEAMEREVYEETGYKIRINQEQLFNVNQVGDYLIVTGIGYLLDPQSNHHLLDQSRTQQDILIQHQFFSYTHNLKPNLFDLHSNQCVPHLHQIINRFNIFNNFI